MLLLLLYSALGEYLTLKMEPNNSARHLRWLEGLKLIQLIKQKKTQLPFITLAKNLKAILCRVTKGT